MGFFGNIGQALGFGPDTRAQGLQGALGQYAPQTNQQLAALQQQAAGKGPSVAAEQLRQGLARGVAGQHAMAASARPGQEGMAARMAAQQSGRLTAGASGQAAVARMMEQQAAQQQLNQLLLGLRGQNVQGQLGLMQQPTQGERLLGMGSGIAGAALLSDRDAKTSIKRADKDADRLLDGLRAYSYRYKDARHGAGRQLGVMAQDLERAGLHQAVTRTPAGKTVDVGKLAGGLAAAAARLHDRVTKLEDAA